MQWCDFYDNFWDWADSTRKTRISSLEDVGSGDEIVDVILEIQDEKVRSQLIRKAIKLGATFTNDDFMNLDGELQPDIYEELGKYAGYDHNDPYFDEDNMTWDDFYCYYSDWDTALLTRRLHKLSDFGPSYEVFDAIQNLPTSELEDLLCDKAIAAGVKFSREEKIELGLLGEVFHDFIEEDLSDEAINQMVENAENLVKGQEKIKRENRRLMVLGAVIGILSGLSPRSKDRRRRRRF